MGSAAELTVAECIAQRSGQGVADSGGAIAQLDPMGYKLGTSPAAYCKMSEASMALIEPS